MAEWVTQKEAARRETAAGRPISQPNVSRYLSRHAGDVPVELNDGGMVVRLDYETFAAHRSGNLGVLDKAAGRAAVRPRTPAPVHAAQADATTRKRLAEAERAEIELAARKGELIARATVRRAIQSAGLRFVQALERRRRVLAARVAGVEEVRAVEATLKAADRELLDALVDDLAAAAAALEQGEADADPAARGFPAGHLEPAGLN